MPHYVSLQEKWTLFRFARKTDGFFVSPPFSSRLSLVLAFVDIASIGTSQSNSLEHQNVMTDKVFVAFFSQTLFPSPWSTLARLQHQNLPK